MASENSVVKCVPEKKLKFWLQTEVWEVFFFSECVIGKQKNIKLKKSSYFSRSFLSLVV